MSSATQSTETLFHSWRKGDPAAGQAMAQRFTDWYFAIATCRLGEEVGDAAFREACNAFSRGVGRVADARRLLGWAHGIVRDQIATGGGRRLTDGDLASAWTRKQPPKQLLLHARQAIPDEMAVLEIGYRDGRATDPQRLLGARYALKRWLKERFEIPFRVVPTTPDPDRAPLAFYEAGRLADEQEETYFELYMLTDMEVCQDVAEFAHYAIALRGGLPGEIPKGRPASATQELAEAKTVPVVPAPSGAPSSPAPAAGPPAKAAGGAPALPGWAIGAGVAAMLLVVVLVILAALM